MDARRRVVRRWGPLVALAVTWTSLVATPAPAQEAATVTVAANRFDPFEAAVDPGGRVTWLVQEGGHTIVADDRRFVLRGEGGGALPAGATVSAGVGGTDAFVDYYCEIHGGPGLQGMSGRIRVGDPAGPPAATTPVIRVPRDRPTIADALAAAAPGHRIEVAAGSYGIATPLVVGVDGVTIAGIGTDPEDVLLTAAPGQRGFPRSAFRVTAARVRIENLTVRGFRSAGIHLDRATAATLVEVHVDGAAFSLDGILAEGVRGATLRRTWTTGARRAGVRVADCATCGVRLTGVRSTGNLVGILIESAAGVEVTGATVRRNGAGVVGRAGRDRDPARPVVVAVRRSAIRDNTDRELVGLARSQDLLLPTGAGVWLEGPRDSVVVANDIRGNAYGIAVAGDVAQRTEVRRNRLRDNTDADLAWDGLGADVCFSANRSSSRPDVAASSEPAAIETLYPCGRSTVGIPYPVVLLRLLLHALSGGDR